MKQILCFGDSNTYGLIPREERRFEWGIRWSSILDERVRKKGYRVVEEGLCGRTTIFNDTYRRGRKGTELLPVLLEAHSPVDIVVLMLGTNDCKTVYGATPERIGEGIEELIDQIQTFDPNIQVVLVSPIALGSNVWKEEYDIEFNQHSVEVSRKLPEVYENIAKKRGIEFLAASDYANPSSIDQEHMDAENHRFFAEAISRKVQGLITKKVVADHNRVFFCFRANVLSIIDLLWKKYLEELAKYKDKALE